MKKLISVLVALSLVVGVAFTAMADDSKEFDSVDDKEDPPYSCTTSDISITVDTGDTKVRYNVVVEWDDISFTYDRGDSAWYPYDDGTNDGHTYSDDGEWDKDVCEDAITVYNHSNAAVEVSIDPVSETGVTVTASTTDDEELVSAATEGIYGNYDKADSVTYTLTATGVPTADGTFTISGIEVVIAAA